MAFDARSCNSSLSLLRNDNSIKYLEIAWVTKLIELIIYIYLSFPKSRYSTTRVVQIHDALPSIHMY